MSSPDTEKLSDTQLAGSLSPAHSLKQEQANITFKAFPAMVKVRKTRQSSSARGKVNERSDPSVAAAPGRLHCQLLVLPPRLWPRLFRVNWFVCVCFYIF